MPDFLTDLITSAIDAATKLENLIELRSETWWEYFPQFERFRQAIEALPNPRQVNWKPYRKAYCELLRLQGPAAATVAQLRNASTELLPSCWTEASLLMLHSERTSIRMVAAVAVDAASDDATLQAWITSRSKFTQTHSPQELIFELWLEQRRAVLKPIEPGQTAAPGWGTLRTMAVLEGDLLEGDTVETSSTAAIWLKSKTEILDCLNIAKPDRTSIWKSIVENIRDGRCPIQLEIGPGKKPKVRQNDLINWWNANGLN